MKMHGPKQTSSQNISRIMQLLHRGKPKNDGSKICTNIRILHHKDIDIIFGDLRFDTDVQAITEGLHIIKHYHAVKAGYIYGILDTIILQEWSERLSKFIFRVIEFKSLMYLQTSSINDGYTFKSASNTMFTPLFR